MSWSRRTRSGQQDPADIVEVGLRETSVLRDGRWLAARAARSTRRHAHDAAGSDPRGARRRCLRRQSPAAVADAQTDGDRQPRTQRTLTPAGETEVNYYDGGTLTQSTRIPADSVFNTSGRGSGGGGVAQPCFEFSWFVTEPNPNAVVDPVTSAVVDATTGLPTTPDHVGGGASAVDGVDLSGGGPDGHVDPGESGRDRCGRCGAERGTRGHELGPTGSGRSTSRTTIRWRRRRDASTFAAATHPATQVVSTPGSCVTSTCRWPTRSGTRWCAWGSCGGWCSCRRSG